MTLIDGNDVSSYQPNWEPKKGQEFVGIKSTEGTSYINPAKANQEKEGRDDGLVILWYHWLHHGNIAAQVDYFARNTNIKPGDVLVCDWEQKGCTTADKDQYIKALKKRYPNNRVLLYCNTSWWTGVDTSGYKGDGLWIAWYSSTRPPIATPWLFWQFSQTPIDQNRSSFTSMADLKTWAGCKAEASVITSATVGGLALPAYKSSGEKILWRPLYHNNNVQAKYACYCVTKAIAIAEARLIKLGVIKECLDFWQFGWGSAASASALTHAAGGVVDVVQTDAVTQKVLREVGFAAGWYRGPGAKYGNFSTPHFHGVLAGCPHAHQQAKDQITDVRNGLNGLANKGADYGPKVPYITWQDAWKKYVTTTTAPVASKEDGDMAKPIVTRRTKDRKLAKSKKYASLVISDKSDTGYAVAKGPGVVKVLGTIDVDQPCYVRFIEMDWKPGVIKEIQAYPRIHADPGGNVVAFYHNLGNPTKGFKQRHLRIQVCPIAATTTVKDLYLSAGKES